jgi:S1-C subfamily serine protease
MMRTEYLPDSTDWDDDKEENMNNILVELSSSMAVAVENASASTVMVNARQRLPGSGMVFAPGLVLTGNHVVSPDENILILFSDGKEIAVNFAGRDHGSD